MKTISKFHAGMLKASALAVLNAIAKDNYQAVISKSAKLMLLATKLNVKLHDVLPKSVVNCIRNILTKLYVNWHGVHTNLCALALSVGWGFVTKNNIAVIATLVKLPKNTCITLKTNSYLDRV